MTIYKKSPVFPETDLSETDAGLATITTVSGISIREYFAGLAMQGLLSSDYEAKTDLHGVAAVAVSQADALIDALNKVGASDHHSPYRGGVVMFSTVTAIDDKNVEIKSYYSGGEVAGEITFRACNNGSIEAFASIESSGECLRLSFDKHKMLELINELQRIRHTALRLKHDRQR